MRFGSTITGAVIGVLALAMFLALELIPLLSTMSGPPPRPSAEMGAPDRFAHLAALFAALPGWVVVWMKFQDIIMAASLLFVLWHREAQIYALGLLASHALFFAAVPLVPAPLVSLELSALSHWVWLPALVVLIRAWPRIDRRSGYGVWCAVAIAQLAFSLSFDVPDGVRLLLAAVT